MMLQHLKDVSNQSKTTNGDHAYGSTLNSVLDLFGRGGALRHDECEFIRLLDKAYADTPDLALKTLFYLRDIRGGQGERDVFRAGLLHLANVKGGKMGHLIPMVPVYGRFDDLFVLFDTPLEKGMVDFVLKQLQDDLDGMNSNEPVSLLAKWMPSENASSKATRKLAKRFVKAFEFHPSEYRKMLVLLRNHIDIVETKLSNGSISEIDYEKTPSKAHQQYRASFMRRDGVRYSEYLEAVEDGRKKMSASTLYPYDVVHRAGHENSRTLDALWNNLPDFTGGKQDNSLVVVDVSGSMGGFEPNSPLNVAIGLGLYISERNTGHFQNHFLTFSEIPELVEVKGTSISNKIQNMRRANWDMTTNLEATFDLILNTAIKTDLPQEQMIRRLILVSDMQFNQSVRNGNVRVIDSCKKAFESAGYPFPEVIFWNVAGHSTVPVTKNEQGVALVSGASPSTLKAILASKDLSPERLMLDVLLSERYDNITA